ncbi:hypothetical protein KI387_002792, partial [Taxus chinensis]
WRVESVRGILNWDAHVVRVMMRESEVEEVELEDVFGGDGYLMRGQVVKKLLQREDLRER